MIEREIYQVLTGSTVITDLVGSNVFHHHLPDNHPLDENAIVFIINKDEGLDSLDGKNELEYHTLDIIVVDADTIEIETIVSSLEDLLNEYDDNSIRDCECTNVSPTMDAEKDQYIKKMTFNVIYDE